MTACSYDDFYVVLKIVIQKFNSGKLKEKKIVERKRKIKVKLKMHPKTFSSSGFMVVVVVENSMSYFTKAHDHREGERERFKIYFRVV